jgi:hypothetical protein
MRPRSPTCAWRAASAPLGEHLQRAARVRQEGLAERGERHAAPAREERAAQLRLERLHARAHRRLPDAERHGGAGEAALADDVVERGELVAIHVAPHR